MAELREVMYQKIVPSEDGHYLLTADIGGTNANFGLFVTNQVAKGILPLVASFHYKSRFITDFCELVNMVLSRIQTLYGIHITQASFAAAGVISADGMHVKPTNLPVSIDLAAIRAKTSLTQVLLANDFEVIGYGLPFVDPATLVLVNRGQPYPHGHKAILGAGTGLGKAVLFWDAAHKRYETLASEGGHADCVFLTHQELEIAHFIQECEQFTDPVSWEGVLSGNGIKRLYQFFSSKISDGAVRHGADGPRPDEIFASRHDDAACMKTYEFYAQIYGRCAKNFALDALCLSGLYIAGGIAAKNLALFQQPVFMKEFISSGKQSERLKKVPIYVITDYNVSLYGAASLFLLRKGQ